MHSLKLLTFIKMGYKNTKTYFKTLKAHLYSCIFHMHKLKILKINKTNMFNYHKVFFHMKDKPLLAHRDHSIHIEKVWMIKNTSMTLLHNDFTRFSPYL